MKSFFRKADLREDQLGRHERYAQPYGLYGGIIIWNSFRFKSRFCRFSVCFRPYRVW